MELNSSQSIEKGKIIVGAIEEILERGEEILDTYGEKSQSLLVEVSDKLYKTTMDGIRFQNSFEGFLIAGSLTSALLLEKVRRGLNGKKDKYRK